MSHSDDPPVLPEGGGTPVEPARGRTPLARWWHGLSPWQRRTMRQLVSVLVTGLVALTVGVFTASAPTTLGPHEARISTTMDHLVRIDLGPLGSVELDSPVPWPLGVHVDVGEIPDTLTDVESPLEGLGGDVAAYAQFFSQPQDTVRIAVTALAHDALRRTMLLWSLALVSLAAVRLAAGGLLRIELYEKLRRQGVAPLVAVTVVALVVVPVGAALTSHTSHGRPSQVLAEIGGPLADARVTGRLASLIDTYGELALTEIRRNDEFYAVITQNVVQAYAEDSEPLAPRRPLRATVPVAPVTPTATEDAEEPSGEPAEDGHDGAASPSTDAAATEGAGEATAPDGETTAPDSETAAPDGEATAPDGEQDAEASSAVGPSPSPTPTPTATPVSRLTPDPVTLLVFSDTHCNIGMAPVLGEIARQSGADVVLNAGDTTMGGSSVEAICVDTLAAELTDWPVVVADGNHDSHETGRQEAARGWTVLDGGVVEVEGLRIVGDRDPRFTSVTLGNEEFVTKAVAGAELTQAACAATDPDDPSSAVDLLLVHDPYVGSRVMPSGCVVLEVSGHLHRRIGPLQQGLGLLYVNATSGGARVGVPPLGPLQANAFVSVIVYDRANHEPTALREIVIGRDQSVTLGDWEPFPVRPTEVVEADLSEATHPVR